METRALVVVAVLFFGVMALLGRTFHASRLWKLVDPIYYLLGAASVLMLFELSRGERELLEQEALVSEHRVQLEALVKVRPLAEVQTSPGMVDASFDLIATIHQFAAACSGTMDVHPRCAAAKSLETHTRRFFTATHQTQSLELRLAEACAAADSLFSTIGSGEVVSLIVGQELLDEYTKIVGRAYSPWEYVAVENDAAQFESRVRTRVERLRVVLGESEAARYVVEVYKSEAEFGQVMLLGAFPCMTSPRESLTKLAEWTVRRQTEEEALARARRDAERLAEQRSGGPLQLRRANLNLWPVLALIAASLKFGRALRP